MESFLYFQVEVATLKWGRTRWWHFARIRFSRDYTLFALLAGVRRNEVADLELECEKPRGLPDDVSDARIDEDALTINDEAARLEIAGTCMRSAAEGWVKAGLSRYLDDGNAVTHPDFYGQSWATAEDLEKIIQRYRKATGRDVEGLGAVVAMMKSLAEAGQQSRGIFWFEN